LKKEIITKQIKVKMILLEYCLRREGVSQQIPQSPKLKYLTTISFYLLIDCLVVKKQGNSSEEISTNKFTLQKQLVKLPSLSS